MGGGGGGGGGGVSIIRHTSKLGQTSAYMADVKFVDIYLLLRPQNVTGLTC